MWKHCRILMDSVFTDIWLLNKNNYNSSEIHQRKPVILESYLSIRLSLKKWMFRLLFLLEQKAYVKILTEYQYSKMQMPVTWYYQWTVMTQSRKKFLFFWFHADLPFSRWRMSYLVQKCQPNVDLHDYTEFVSLKLQCPDYQACFPFFAFLAENTYATCIIKSLKNPVLNN